MFDLAAAPASSPPNAYGAVALLILLWDADVPGVIETRWVGER